MVSGFKSKSGHDLSFEKGYLMVREGYEEDSERVTNAKWTQLSCCLHVLEKGIRTSSSGGKIVAMMESAEPWHGYNFPRRLERQSRNSSYGRSFALGEIRSVFMVVMDVLDHQAS